MMPRLKTAHINGLRALVHLGSLGFLLWLGYAVPAGLLGGDPVQGLTHYLGKGALHLLLLTLLVSPLAKRWRQGQLIKLRRPLGLWCAAWASLHFMVWLGLDLQFDWGLIGGELVKRSYIVVGMVALLLLLALGITSIPALLRRMGPLAEAAQLDLRGGSAGAGTLLVVGQERVAGALIYLVLACALLWPRREKLLRPWRRRAQVAGRGAAQQPSRP